MIMGLSTVRYGITVWLNLKSRVRNYVRYFLECHGTVRKHGVFFCTVS